jgi:hypothetical protein
LSDPYFQSGVQMAVAKNDETITKYGDLKGKTVTVKTGSEGESYAKSIAGKYGFTVKSVDQSATMYEMVKAGNAAAVFDDYPVLAYGIPQLVGHALPNWLWISDLLTLSLTSGSYLTEIIRGAIQSVDAGQTEGARSRPSWCARFPRTRLMRPRCACSSSSGSKRRSTPDRHPCPAGRSSASPLPARWR